MNFNTHQRNGFALMEVIIALAVTALLLTTLMMLEGKVFHRVVSSTARVERFYSIANMFALTRMTPLEKDQKSWTKTLEDPATKLTYEKKPIDSRSALARFVGLTQEVATGSWQEWGRERSTDIINYRFEPKRKEKKDASA